MRALTMQDFGGPEVLSVTEQAVPEAGPGDVLVRVRAAFVAAGRDVGTRAGRGVFPRWVTPPHVLGGEHTGTVAAVGAGVPDELLGARVAVSAPTVCGECQPCRSGAGQDCQRMGLIGISRPGSNAEYTVVPAANVHGLPEETSFVEGAVLAANGPLAYTQLTAAHAAPGEWVVVLGATGSLGSVGVALAVRNGSRVIAATRRVETAAALERLGAEVWFDATRPDLGEAITAATGKGADVVIDNLGLVDLWERYWPALARSGRVVFSGRVGDFDRPLALDVLELFQRRISLTGCSIGDPAAVASFWSQMREHPLELPPDFIHTFPLEQAAHAHELIERGDKVGHYVLTMD